MRRLQDNVFIDHVMGFTVMALITRDGEGRLLAGLAFCSPVDRLSGEWSREKGMALCAKRAADPETQLHFRGLFSVKDYLLGAIMKGHSYVPDSISRRALKEARKALDKKVQVGHKRAARPKEAIYRFEVDCGRQGMIEGIFSASPEELEGIYGFTQYFHDEVGKHSEIKVTYDETYFTTVSDDPAAVKMFNDIGAGNGINPLTYDTDALEAWREEQQAEAA